MEIQHLMKAFYNLIDDCTQVYGYPTIESSERNKQWDFTEIISNHFVLPALIQQKLPQFIYTALIFYLTLHAKIVNSN